MVKKPDQSSFYILKKTKLNEKQHIEKFKAERIIFNSRKFSQNIPEETTSAKKLESNIDVYG